MPIAARRMVLGMVLALVALATFGCGGSDDDDDGPKVTFTKGTARIRCFGGDCFGGVVRDGGVFFVGVTRTIDGVSESVSIELPELTHVDIETGDGSDHINLVDSGIPGTLRIATGAGDDFLDLCDTSAQGDARVDTGSGNDTASFAPGRYGRTFRVDLGDGDDNLYIDGGHFIGEARVDGGAGDDLLDDLSSTFHHGLTAVSFERRPDLEQPASANGAVPRDER